MNTTVLQVRQVRHYGSTPFKIKPILIRTLPHYGTMAVHHFKVGQFKITYGITPVWQYSILKYGNTALCSCMEVH